MAGFQHRITAGTLLLLSEPQAEKQKYLSESCWDLLITESVRVMQQNYFRSGLFTEGTSYTFIYFLRIFTKLPLNAK